MVGRYLSRPALKDSIEVILINESGRRFQKLGTLFLKK